jgi:hypothetical protein
MSGEILSCPKMGIFYSTIDKSKTIDISTRQRCCFNVLMYSSSSAVVGQKLSYGALPRYTMSEVNGFSPCLWLFCHSPNFGIFTLFITSFFFGRY